MSDDRKRIGILAMLMLSLAVPVTFAVPPSEDGVNT